MGKARMMLASALCLGFLAACGAAEGEQPETGQFPSSGAEGQRLDAVVGGDGFYEVASVLKDGKFLGMQFYKGEPVQLWASEPAGDAVQILLYRKDGTKETVLEAVSQDDTRSGGYLDGEGNYYGISWDRATKLDSSGKKVFSVDAGGSIEEICSAPGGRTALLVRKTDPVNGQLSMSLAELLQDGRLAEVKLESSKGSLSLAAHLGVWGEELLVMDGDYIYRADLQTGALAQAVSLRQTTYVTRQDIALSGKEEKIRALYIPEGGRVELLWADSSGKGRCESLEFKEVSAERETVTLCGLWLDQVPWLKEQAIRFNSASDKYYIVIETPEADEDMDNFVAMTGVKLATGKGPELLFMDTMLDSVDSVIEKGGLLNLAPLMEQSGIREEDYFPLTFGHWRTPDAVYSISYEAHARDFLMRTDVLGDVRNPDMETLLDAMLAYPGQAVYYSGLYAADILREFLCASETLYGMVDWESGTCDFSGGLFAKLLEAARRYQYEKGSSLPEIVEMRWTIRGFMFESLEEYEAAGYAPVCYMFDDGMHPRIDARATLYINANSRNPEGAWEFLRFILSEEVQDGLYEAERSLPVLKKSFYKAAENIIQNGWPKNLIVDYELTQERVDMLAAYIEDARDLPYRTEPILDIIAEEAQGYFDGSRELAQVTEVIRNRVQLFLDERK